MQHDLWVKSLSAGREAFGVAGKGLAEPTWPLDTDRVDENGHGLIAGPGPRAADDEPHAVSLAREFLLDLHGLPERKGVHVEPRVLAMLVVDEGLDGELVAVEVDADRPHDARHAGAIRSEREL